MPKVPPTWTIPKLMGVGVIGAADARFHTLPVTVTVCAVRAVMPRPLVPVPSEVRLTGTVPVNVPGLLWTPLPRPTISDVLLVLPAARGVVIVPPLVVALPVAVPKLASKPSDTPAVAVLAIVKAEVPNVPPVWMLVRVTVGLVVLLILALARFQTLTVVGVLVPSVAEVPSVPFVAVPTDGLIVNAPAVLDENVKPLLLADPPPLANGPPEVELPAIPGEGVPLEVAVKPVKLSVSAVPVPTFVIVEVIVADCDATVPLPVT